MQDMIRTFEITLALDRRNIARIPHNAKHAVMPAIITADRTRILYRIIAAAGTILNRFTYLPDRRCQLMHLILGKGNNVIRQ